MTCDSNRVASFRGKGATDRYVGEHAIARGPPGCFPTPNPTGLLNPRPPVKQRIRAFLTVVSGSEPKLHGSFRTPARLARNTRTDNPLSQHLSIASHVQPSCRRTRLVIL